MRVLLGRGSGRVAGLRKGLFRRGGGARWALARGMVPTGLGGCPARVLLGEGIRLGLRGGGEIPDWGRGPG